jgi:nitrile hydratase
MRELIAKGATTLVSAPTTKPKFKVGDRVIARTLSPVTHTRLARYVRGKRGRIERVHGVFALPDTNAIGAGRSPQYVYSVSFDASELWGPQGRRGDRIYIDLWDDYLDPV